MGLKSFVIGQYAHYIRSKIKRQAKNALIDQQAQFSNLISKGKIASFGKDHHLDEVRSYEEYKQRVPIRDYEALRPYVDKIIQGESDVLWPGKPKYFAKTSGTTSGVKYIPITNESIKSQINTARNAILNFVSQTGANLFSGKMIFLSGSPVLNTEGPIATGRLSGIVNHEIPVWANSNKLPSYETNCTEEWEDKLDHIVNETLGQEMSLISGIPPWVQMYYEKLIERTGKKYINDIFPNLKLFVHGGVNYKPYKRTMESLMGSGIYTLETYPASEGFIAYQDDMDDEGLLLNTSAGLFFEFVPVNKINDAESHRISLAEVDVDIDYAIYISSDAGLWSYDIGDMVRFTSLDPYKIVVSGRTKHFISAFGEHVISKEVEDAMEIVSKDHDFTVVDFTVAPQVSPQSGLPYHEWFVEFVNTPDNLTEIEIKLDEEIIRQNIYYRDLITGNIIQTLKITPLKKNAFRDYMQSIGKLGGQNKVPRLKNDRQLAKELKKYAI